jgi:hypothetical protein
MELSLKNLEISISNDPLFHATGLRYFIVLFPTNTLKAEFMLQAPATL